MNSPILVTGASQRVGLALALELAQAGHTVVSASRSIQPQAAHPNIVQFQADLLGIPVVRPKVVETTALGAAYLAGLATGVYPDMATLGRLWQAERTFYPTLSRDRAAELMGQWERAVRQACVA